MIAPWHIYHSIRQKRLVLHPALGGTPSQRALSKSELEKFIWPPGGYNAYLKQVEECRARREREAVTKVQWKDKPRPIKQCWSRFKAMYRLGSPIWPPAIVFNIPIFFLGLIGMIISWKNWQKTTLFIFLIISWTILHILFVSRARYSHPVRPYLMMFAAYVVVWGYEKIRRTGRDKELFREEEVSRYGK